MKVRNFLCNAFLLALIVLLLVCCSSKNKKASRGGQSVKYESGTVKVKKEMFKW